MFNSTDLYPLFGIKMFIIADLTIFAIKHHSYTLAHVGGAGRRAPFYPPIILIIWRGRVLSSHTLHLLTIGPIVNNGC